MAARDQKYELVGDEKAPFTGYNSCPDKTRTRPTDMIRGSFNMYKKRSGNIANRPGLKRRGQADGTAAGTVSSFTWNNSVGSVLPLRVNANRLQLESDIADGSTLAWLDLHETGTLANPAASLARFVFATWWEQLEQADRLLMVRGDSKVLHWSGGVAKVASSAAVAGTVGGTALVAAGTGYAAGDVLTIAGGGGNAKVTLTAVSSGAISAFYLSAVGSGYSVGVVNLTGGSGGGATINVTSVQTRWTLTKSDPGTTWGEAGFNVTFTSPSTLHPGDPAFYKKIVIGAAEYAYYSGEDTATLQGVTPDPTAVPAGSVAVQSVFPESLVQDIPDDDFAADFMTVLANQAIYGSYSSRVVHISTDQTTSNATTTKLGFTNLVNNPATSMVIGDPDYVILDDLCNGLVARGGSAYASAGSSDWYELTPNYTPPTGVPLYHGINTGQTAYVITRVVKKPGTGRGALLAHEFADVIGNSIVYVGKDNQVRVIGSFNALPGDNFPSISRPVAEELGDEDFTGGHLKTISDIVYITAPVSGRDWMYQVRDDVDQGGTVVAERYWHPPQVRGISRFEDIGGVTHGHSSANPVLHEVWDTGQWWDDAATDGGDGEPEQLAYNCVMRMAYRNHGERFLLKGFGYLAVEGYMEYGTPLYANIYCEYQGNSKTLALTVSDDDEPATFYAGSPFISIGGEPLGTNPLGMGPIPESEDQELLPKFRALLKADPGPVLEYAVELLSSAPGARWEIVCLGTDVSADYSQPTYLKK